MSLDVLGWLSFAGAAMVFGYVLGFYSGREGAERRAEATIADLRIALRRFQRDGYLTDEGRPE